MKKQRSKYLRLSMIRESILMVCGGTHKELEKRFARISDCVVDEVPKSSRADGRTLHGKGYYAVWCESAQPSLIAHEAVHVALNILDDRGIQKDEELLAYMVQFIVREYLDAFSN